MEEPANLFLVGASHDAICAFGLSPTIFTGLEALNLAYWLLVIVEPMTEEEYAFIDLIRDELEG